MSQINYKEIQGIVFSGYGKMEHASYYLLKINDPENTLQWIKQSLQSNAISHGNTESGDHRMNIAFSASGFLKLNIDQKSMDTFDLGFQDGMSSDRRAKVLGDQGPNAKEYWHWGGGKDVHMLVMLYSCDAKTHEQKDADLSSQLKQAGMEEIKKLEATAADLTQLGKFSREHFGFADGVSQPIIKNFRKPSRENIDPSLIKEINTGEFLLGMKNEYDRETNIPNVGKHGNKFGINGSYLVFRQLEQDVTGFWDHVNQTAVKLEQDPEYIASKMVGRWPNGAPVLPGQTTNPDATATNNFDFTKDADGFGCPFGSHIRRSNPRGITLSDDPEKAMQISNRHRILRRGRSYGIPIADKGVDDKTERGLIFICLNANIERQFEFLQHSWVNNVKFAELYNEIDPIIGFTKSTNNNYSIPNKPFRLRTGEFNRFVTMRGGEYFFLPSMTALSMLANGS